MSREPVGRIYDASAGLRLHHRANRRLERGGTARSGVGNCVFPNCDESDANRRPPLGTATTRWIAFERRSRRLRRAAICRLGLELDLWREAARRRRGSSPRQLVHGLWTRCPGCLAAPRVAAEERSPSASASARALLGRDGHAARRRLPGRARTCWSCRRRSSRRRGRDLHAHGRRRRPSRSSARATPRPTVSRSPRWLGRELARPGRSWSPASPGASTRPRTAARSRRARPTVAVLGCGLAVDYPRGHRELGPRIRSRGALVTRVSLRLRRPSAGNFPVRNRIIAALAEIDRRRRGRAALRFADHGPPGPRARAARCSPCPAGSPTSSALGANDLLARRRRAGDPSCATSSSASGSPREPRSRGRARRAPRARRASAPAEAATSSRPSIRSTTPPGDDLRSPPRWRSHRNRDRGAPRARARRLGDPRRRRRLPPRGSP